MGAIFLFITSLHPSIKIPKEGPARCTTYFLSNDPMTERESEQPKVKLSDF